MVNKQSHVPIKELVGSVDLQNFLSNSSSKFEIWSANLEMLPQNKYGCQHDLSTMHAVSHLKEAIKKNVKKCGQFYACLMIAKMPLVYYGKC